MAPAFTLADLLPSLGRAVAARTPEAKSPEPEDAGAWFAAWLAAWMPDWASPRPAASLTPPKAEPAKDGGAGETSHPKETKVIPVLSEGVSPQSNGAPAASARGVILRTAQAALAAADLARAAGDVATRPERTQNPHKKPDPAVVEMPAAGWAAAAARPAMAEVSAPPAPVALNPAPAPEASARPGPAPAASESLAPRVALPVSEENAAPLRPEPMAPAAFRLEALWKAGSESRSPETPPLPVAPPDPVRLDAASAVQPGSPAKEPAPRRLPPASAHPAETPRSSEPSARPLPAVAWGPEAPGPSRGASAHPLSPAPEPAIQERPGVLKPARTLSEEASTAPDPPPRPAPAGQSGPALEEPEPKSAPQLHGLERAIERAAWRQSGAASEVNLWMRPEHLGKVAVRLVERAGAVEVAVRAESPAARGWLAEWLPTLVEGLRERGFEVQPAVRDGGVALDWWAQERRGGGQGQDSGRKRRGGRAGSSFARAALSPEPGESS